MKKFKISKYIISAVSLLAVSAMLFTGCSKKNKLDVVGVDLFEDKNTGVVYKVAPASYEAMSVTDELYAVAGDAELYVIDGADPEKWLCESTGSVFYAEDIELPTIETMDLARIELLLEGVTIATITDDFFFKKISAVYMGGESISRPMVSDYEINWRVRFVDESLGLYFTLAYIEISEDYIVENEDGSTTNYGRKFLFDRFENRCVQIDDAFDSYVAEYKALNKA